MYGYLFSCNITSAFWISDLCRSIFLTNPSMWVPAQHMPLVVGNMECHTVRPLTRPKFQIAWQISGPLCNRVIITRCWFDEDRPPKHDLQLYRTRHRCIVNKGILVVFSFPFLNERVNEVAAKCTNNSDQNFTLKMFVLTTSYQSSKSRCCILSL